MDAASSRRAFANPYMTQGESTLYEGALPGVFVPDATIRAIDACMSVLFVTVESTRRYLAETDDGSLEWQLLRRALHEGFFDTLRTLDSAGLLETTSQYPENMREALRSRGAENAGSSTNVSYPDSMLDKIVHIGRMLLKNYMIGRELADSEKQRRELLRLRGDGPLANGEPI